MTLRQYPCGIDAGEILALRDELYYRDYDGNLTGEVRQSGEQAMVLTGNPDEPDVIWIRWRDGERQTWDEDILDTFERAGRVT